MGEKPIVLLLPGYETSILDIRNTPSCIDYYFYAYYLS